MTLPNWIKWSKVKGKYILIKKKEWLVFTELSSDYSQYHNTG